MTNIAIFENLNKGGALNQVKNYVKCLNKLGYKVDIYTHTQNKIKYANNIYYDPIQSPNNPVEEILHTIPSLKEKQKKFSVNIIKRKYSLILVFPCKITQCPFINQYLRNENSYYMFLESKREFYENTSFDYHTPKRIIARIIRYPIKVIDKNNCKKTKNIISISYYAKYILQKIYQKKSIVIYPNLRQIRTVKHKIINYHNFLSVGLISKLKNNNFTIIQLKPYKYKLNLIGNYSNDAHDKNIISKHCTLFTNFNNKQRNLKYKKNTFFTANQLFEPFGLTTLEAVNYKNYILGLNIGGTSEIVQNGLNGILYSNNIITARKLIRHYINKKYLSIYQTCIIDWNSSIKKILDFTHTPNA